MNATLTINGKETVFIVLELCSYGDHGDYQILPTRAVSIGLDSIAECLKLRGFPVAVKDNRLLSKIYDTDVMLFSSGRMVLESVRPDSKSAAWTIALSVLSSVPIAPLKTGMIEKQSNIAVR
jgi:hypothetical protein